MMIGIKYGFVLACCCIIIFKFSINNYNVPINDVLKALIILKQIYLYLSQMFFNVNLEKNLYIVKTRFTNSCISIGLIFTVSNQKPSKIFLWNLCGLMSISLLGDLQSSTDNGGIIILGGYVTFVIRMVLLWPKNTFKISSILW